MTKNNYLPYTQETFDNCCIGLNKPGIAHPRNNPYNNSLSDCAIVCCPCALMIDLFILPFKLLKIPFRCFIKKNTVIPNTS